MKSSKALKLGVLVLSLGALGACNKTDTDKPGDQPADATHEHVAAAEWQQSATKHWHKCTDATCKQKLDEANHDFDAEYDVVPATCEVDGSSKQKCKVCGYVKNNVKAAPGHTYEKDDDGNDKVTWTKRADCTEAGEGTKTCTVCTAVENVTEAALGHEYAKDETTGEDIVTWTKEANCTEAGQGSKVCKRTGCTHIEPVTKEALGHDLELVGGEAQAAEGKATVRLYHCKRAGCDTEYMGFKATEVTSASMETLYKVTNGDKEGYRFFGHPIGNDVALNDVGDADQNNHPAVYNKDQKGDFFEYVFDLTAQQAEKLTNCKLYCEATPADWLQSTGTDFWKVKGDAANDWTYGMYIDDAAEHKPTENADGSLTGVIVEDFRYVLYVDDVLQTMDYSIDTPAGANGSVGEYVLPFTFHLHAGENKIRLVMSGGYRSTFYNFTFRPYEEPTTPPEPVHEHTWNNDACECGATRVAIAAVADATIVGENKAGTPDGFLKLKANGNTATYSFNAEAAGKAELVVEAAMDTWENGNKNQSMFSGNTNGNIKFTANGSVMDLSKFQGKNYGKMFPSENPIADGHSGTALIDIGEIDLVSGANSLVIERVASYNILIRTIYIVFPAPVVA